MLRAWLIYALSRAVAEEDPTAAARALRGCDPLLAVFARRRLRRALREVAPMTNLGDELHHARLAQLRLARGEFEADADDAAGIAREQAALAPARAPRRGPWLVRALSAALMGAVVLGLLGAHLTRPFDPRRSTAGRALGEELPAFIGEAFKGKSADPARLERLAARATDEAGELGAPAATELAALVEAARGLATASPPQLDPASERFIGASVGFNKALASAGLAYFVDADWIRDADGARPLVTSYYVQRERWRLAGAREERSLFLWRLDPLRITTGALGYTRPHSPAAIVLLDQVEEDLVLYFLPGLAPGEPVVLVDEATDSRDEPWAVRLGAAAGDLVRRYRRAAFGERHPELERIGVLLARRRALVRRWAANLRAQGAELRVPVRLVPERDYAAELERRISRAELREWDELHAELVSPANLAAFEAIRDAYATDIERHELQHRIDYQAGLIPVPEELARLLGVADPLDVHPRSLPAVARGELSAELAAVAQAQGSPLLSVVMLTRFMTNNHLLGSPHGYAAWVALRGIGRELGIDVDALPAGSRARRSAAELLVRIGQRPDDAIRRASERCFERCFGAPLAITEFVRETANPPWRGRER